MLSDGFICRSGHPVGGNHKPTHGKHAKLVKGDTDQEACWVDAEERPPLGCHILCLAGSRPSQLADRVFKKKDEYLHVFSASEFLTSLRIITSGDHPYFFVFKVR